MRVPGVVRQPQPLAVGPVLRLFPPVDGDEPRPRFDQAAREQDRLAVAVTAVAVAQRLRLAFQVKRRTDLRAAEQRQRLLPEALELLILPPAGRRTRLQVGAAGVELA